MLSRAGLTEEIPVLQISASSSWRLTKKKKKKLIPTLVESEERKKVVKERGVIKGIRLR